MHFSSLKLVAGALLLALIFVGCGGSTLTESAGDVVAQVDADAGSAAGQSSSNTVEQTSADEPASAVQDGYMCTVGGSIEFDTAIGWVVTGTDGATFEIVDEVTMNGVPQVVLNDTFTLFDQKEWLYTGFVEDASVDIAVTSGGPVEFTMFYGNVDDETYALTITEELESVSVADGEMHTLSAINPCS